MTMLAKLLEWVAVHPTEVFIWVSAAVAMWKGRDWLTAKINEPRNKQILQVAHLAFMQVEEMGILKKLPAGMAKSAVFMDQLDRLALGLGLGELDGSEKDLAKAVASNLSLATKVPVPLPPQPASAG